MIGATQHVPTFCLRHKSTVEVRKSLTRKWIVVAWVLVAILLAGNRGCTTADRGTIDDGTPAQPEPQPIPVPEPVPDHRPALPTPNPANADPEPEETHVWQVFFSWSPARSPAVTSYKVGPHGLGFGRERRNGHWASNQLVVHGEVSAWAEIKMTKEKGQTGSVKCWISKDNKTAPGPNAELSVADNVGTVTQLSVRCSVAKGAK